MIRLRPVGADEVADVLELMPLYYADDGLEFDAERAAGAVRALVSDPSLGRLWLIHEESGEKPAEKAVGYLVLAYCYSLEFGGREAFIDELFVLEEHRGKGIGSEALRLVFRECGREGLRALRLEVTRGNDRALRLYQRLGFKDLGRTLLAQELK